MFFYFSKRLFSQFKVCRKNLTTPHHGLRNTKLRQTIKPYCYRHLCHRHPDHRHPDHRHPDHRHRRRRIYHNYNY